MNEDEDRIEGLSQLRRVRAPARDLWPGIAARLAPRRSRYGWAQLALAASLVAGLSAVLTLQMARTPDAGPAGAVVARAALPHDSRAIVKANLAIVRQAEQQLRQALEQDPDSASLHALLASARDRQRALRAML